MFLDILMSDALRALARLPIPHLNFKVIDLLSQEVRREIIETIIDGIERCVLTYISFKSIAVCIHDGSDPLGIL